MAYREPGFRPCDQCKLVIAAALILGELCRDDCLNSFYDAAAAPCRSGIFVVGDGQKIGIHEARIKRDLSGRGYASPGAITGKETVMLTVSVGVRRGPICLSGMPRSIIAWPAKTSRSAA